LTFEEAGLTIIFGDNGTGKSGYARLLKRITRARHQEEILSDVIGSATL
jgi:predicted ATPase